jgi:hypothetical protein
MKIAQIKTLDVGMSKISCSGKITWTGKKRDVPAGTTKGGKPYNAFSSQFVVIQDDTDKIGVDVSLATDSNPLPKDQTINLENCTLKSYVGDDGQTSLKLSGRLAHFSQPQGGQMAGSTGQQTADMGDMVKVRSMAYSYVKDIAIANLRTADEENIKPLSLIEDAIGVTAFIATGIVPKEVVGKAELNAAEQAGENIEYHEEQPPEAGEEQPPF